MIALLDAVASRLDALTRPSAPALGPGFPDVLSAETGPRSDAASPALASDSEPLADDDAPQGDGAALPTPLALAIPAPAPVPAEKPVEKTAGEAELESLPVALSFLGKEHAVSPRGQIGSGTERTTRLSSPAGDGETDRAASQASAALTDRQPIQPERARRPDPQALGAPAASSPDAAPAPPEIQDDSALRPADQPAERTFETTRSVPLPQRGEAEMGAPGLAPPSPSSAPPSLDGEGSHPTAPGSRVGPTPSAPLAPPSPEDATSPVPAAFALPREVSLGPDAPTASETARAPGAAAPTTAVPEPLPREAVREQAATAPNAPLPTREDEVAPLPDLSTRAAAPDTAEHAHDARPADTRESAPSSEPARRAAEAEASQAAAPRTPDGTDVDEAAPLNADPAPPPDTPADPVPDAAAPVAPTSEARAPSEVRSGPPPAPLPARLAVPAWLGKLSAAATQSVQVMLGEDGTVRLQTQREGDGVTVSVRFSDPELHALAGAHAVRLRDVLDAHFAEPVRLSLSDGLAADAGTSDGRHAGDASPKASAGPRGDSARPPSSPSSAPARAAASGRREWVG